MKRKTYVIIGVICSILCIACLAVAFWPQDDTDSIQNMVQLSEVEASSEAYCSPVDFATIQNENPDIYGWLYIPNTEISYPLLQREGDDSYYLDHESSGAWAEAGAIFTESSYNGKTFDDPVTLAYGHRMRSGAKFGRLQETFEDAESFLNHKEIIVYLPDRELHFQVFAAVPYTSNHIMSLYNFEKREDYEKFLKTVFDAQGNFREGVSVTPDDQLMILSTCLRWDSSRRYLVLGKLYTPDDFTANVDNHVTEK